MREAPDIYPVYPMLNPALRRSVLKNRAMGDKELL